MLARLPFRQLLNHCLEMTYVISRGDRRFTFPNDMAGMEILHCAIAQAVDFTADTFYSLAVANK